MVEEEKGKKIGGKKIGRKMGRRRRKKLGKKWGRSCVCACVWVGGWEEKKINGEEEVGGPNRWELGEREKEKVEELGKKKKNGWKK